MAACSSMNQFNERVSVSIIVPVYNAKDSIIRCLRSIEKQTFSCFTVIIVNDGSTDSSASLISSYIDDKPNFILENLELNCGVSNARNVGLRLSEGKHIMFIDADDYIQENYLKSLIDASSDVELVCSSFQLQDSNNRLHKRNHGVDASSLIHSEFLKAYLEKFLQKPYAFTMFLHVWNKLFLREIIVKNGIYFDKNLCQLEDLNFVSRYLMKTVSVRYIDVNGYFHCRDGRGYNLSSLSGHGGGQAVDNFFQALEPVAQLESQLFIEHNGRSSVAFSHFLSSMGLLFCLRVARRFWKKPNWSSLKSVYTWLSDFRLRKCLKCYAHVDGESRILRASIKNLPAVLSSPIIVLFGLFR